MICRICKRVITTPMHYLNKVDEVFLCTKCAYMLASENLINEGADDEYHFTIERIDEILDML